MKLLLSNPWIGVAAAALLFAGGMWAGSAWQSNNCLGEQAATSNVSTEMSAELAALRLANANYEARLQEAATNVEANKRLAKERMAEAEAAALAAGVAERQLLLRDKEWKRKFSDAMASPKCAELMEMQVCETAPMP